MWYSMPLITRNVQLKMPVRISITICPPRRADGDADPHPHLLLHVPGDQRHRIPHALRGGTSRRAVVALERGAGARPEGAVVHDLLLGDDGPARAAHGHRRRPPDLDLLARGARPLRPGVLRPGGGDGPLLALRRHRLDLPLPVPLSDSRSASPWLSRLTSKRTSTRRTFT